MHYIKCITYYITSVTFNFYNTYNTLHYITCDTLQYLHYNTFLFSLAGCLSPAQSPALTPGSMCRISQSITHKFPLLPARQNRFCCGVFNFQKEATVHSYQQQ